MEVSREDAIEEGTLQADILPTVLTSRQPPQACNLFKL